MWAFQGNLRAFPIHLQVGCWHFATSTLQTNFKYIPWHLRLSDKTQEELSLHRPRKVPRLEDLLWDDVPLRDIPSNGISQMFLFHLLELISIAYAMLEAAHLSSFRKYNKLFISLAFRKHQAEVGLRNPTVLELQQADRAAWKVISDLCIRGWTLDDALHEVVEVRCVLHSELQPRPAPPKAIRTQKGRGKGKKGKTALPSNTQQKWITSFTDAGGKKLNLCKGWNLRSGCNRKDCQFIHKCCVDVNGKPCMCDHQAYKRT